MEIKEYIRHFDEVFDTKILETMTSKKYPMIDFAFNNLGENLYSQSVESKNISKKKKVISEQIEELNSMKQKQLLDEYEDLDSQLREDIDKQMLILDFAYATKNL